MRSRFWPVLLAALSACRAPAASEPMRERARVLTPSDLLPNDLDFIVRIDAGRVRMSPVLADVIRDLATRAASTIPGPMLPALESARAIFVGGRLMSDGFHGDGVVALEGRSHFDDPRDGHADARFRRVHAHVPDVEIFERASVRRDEAVLKIVLPERGIVLATAAEADAVLRVLNAGPDQGRLDPPAHGLASFAGRRTAAPPWLATRLGPMLRELSEGLTSYTGSIDASEALTFDVWLVYASDAHASRAAKVGRTTLARLQVLDAPVGTVAHSMRLSEAGGSVRIRASVPFAIIARLH
jgi:hypothetical protein